MLDEDDAEEIAREHLANQFSGMVPADRGDLMQLKNHCHDIAWIMWIGTFRASGTITTPFQTSGILATGLSVILLAYALLLVSLIVGLVDMSGTEERAPF
jgi:hypothetical protein